jgi:hypothetical protein
MKKLILVTNDAQSCGKTTTSLVLSEYLRRKQIQHCLVHTSVDQELPCDVEMLNLEEGFTAGELVQLFGKNDAVICDIHTEEGHRFSSFFHKNGLDEILMELNAELTIVLPICDDADVHRQALEMAEAYTGMGEFIALRSPLLADTPESFAGSAVQRAFRLVGATVVNAPALEESVLDQIDELDLTLPLALTQRQLLPRFLTHQLLAWENSFAEVLADVSEHFLPQHDKLDDLGVESAYGQLLSA